jgi:hypothetical protein
MMSMEPFTATMITAMAYTVMPSDDRKLIAVNAPGAIVTLATPASYPDKFCTTIGNASFLQAAIKLRLTQPIGKINEIDIWPGQKLAIELEVGQWSIPADGCSNGRE